MYDPHVVVCEWNGRPPTRYYNLMHKLDFQITTVMDGLGNVVCENKDVARAVAEISDECGAANIVILPTSGYAQTILAEENRRFWEMVKNHDINGLMSLFVDITETMRWMRVVEIICDIPTED